MPKTAQLPRSPGPTCQACPQDSQPLPWGTPEGGGRTRILAPRPLPAPGAQAGPAGLSADLLLVRGLPRPAPHSPVGWGPAGCGHLHPTSRSEQAGTAEGPRLAFKGGDGSARTCTYTPTRHTRPATVAAELRAPC